jgi:hypothetical protein
MRQKRYRYKYGTPAWEREANAMARGWAPNIHACKKCGSPCFNGYCCPYCQDNNPTDPPEEK